MANREQCFETREIVENEVVVVESIRRWRFQDSLEIGISEVGKKYHVKTGLPIIVDGYTQSVILFVEPR